MVWFVSFPDPGRDEVADSTGVPVRSLRVDTDAELVENLGVRSVPTLIALHDGVEVGRLVGLQSISAVRSLFDIGAADAPAVRHRPPVSLIVSRAASGAVVGIAGLVLGSAVLGVIGALGIGWAVVSVVWR